MKRQLEIQIIRDRIDPEPRGLRAQIEPVASVQVGDFRRERSQCAEKHALDAECHFVGSELRGVQVEPFHRDFRSEREIAQHEIPVGERRDCRDAVPPMHTGNVQRLDFQRARLCRIHTEMQPRQLRVALRRARDEIDVCEIHPLRK